MIPNNRIMSKANAWSGTNTPGRHHISNSFQNIRQNHWTMKYRSLSYIYFEVKVCIALTHYPMFDVNPKSLDHWIMKYRSLTNFMMLTFVSHCTDPTQVRHSSIKQSSRYKAKSLKHEIQVTLTSTSRHKSPCHMDD